MPWRQVMRFYLGILVVSFSIAFAFALKGIWMILPFAGLEMLALWVALYIVARRGTRWQSILVSDDRIDIEDRGINCEGQQSFQRAWARVELKKSNIKGYPSRLLLGSHGRSVELGGCLNEIEKQRLAAELRQALQSDIRYQG